MSLQDSSSSHSSSESSYDYESDSSDDYDFGNFRLLQQLEEQDGHSLYNQEPISCPICCERIEEGLAIMLPSCNHSFCTACFLMYLNSRIGEGDADAIGCPYILEEPKNRKQCKALVGDEVLKEIMDATSYQKFMDQKDNAFVRKNVDYHHCPTPDCTNIVLCKSVIAKNSNNSLIRDDADIPRVCDCFKCGRTTCLSCGASPFHKNMFCGEYREQRRRLEEEQRMERERVSRYNPTMAMRSCLHGEGSGSLERLRQVRLHGELGLYQQTEKAEAQYEFQPNPSTINGEEDQLNNIKRCRRCGNGIELREGCLKMKCICGYRFCYKCGSENAQCQCTADGHGFFDQETGWGDFAGLREKRSYT